MSASLLRPLLQSTTNVTRARRVVNACKLRADDTARRQAIRDHFLTELLPPNQTTPEEEARLAEQAKTFPVTRLPYAGERSCLKFDRRNRAPFRNRRGRAFSDKLAWSDVQNGMHFIARATANEMRLHYTPEFSKSDDLLRLVIAQEGFDYAKQLIAGTIEFYLIGRDDRVPEGFVRNREAIESLCSTATEEMRKQVHGTQRAKITWFRHLSWCDAHGGYVALRNAIAYRAWRNAQDAATIAQEMGLSWPGVRQILCRLCESARKLGLETFPRHHSAGRSRN